MDEGDRRLLDRALGARAFGDLDDACRELVANAGPDAALTAARPLRDGETAAERGVAAMIMSVVVRGGAPSCAPAAAGLRELLATEREPWPLIVAIRGLEYAGGAPESLGAILARAGHPDPGVRHHAVAAAGALTDGATAAVTVAALAPRARDEDEGVRAEVAAILARWIIRHPEAGDSLAGLLDDLPEARTWAMWGLARVRDPRATPALVDALGAIETDDPDSQRTLQAAALASDPVLYAPLVVVGARLPKVGGVTAAALAAALSSCAPATSRA